MLSGVVGHYEILSTLGSGGMGVVYKAYDRRLRRPVAIKAIQERELLDGHARNRLRSEALAAASLDHPFICRVYELLDTEQGLLCVMEFVEGETLDVRLKRGHLEIDEALGLATEIAEGLANAHDHGIVHRDIKPSNVMLTPHGHVKLLDFGLAHALITPEAITRTSGDVTRPRAGTPAYMAPEQLLGESITTQTDLFALGGVLFQCLSGELPFEGKSTGAYEEHLLSSPPKTLAKLRPEVPAAAVRLINRCLAKQAADRPRSAADVAAELRQIMQELTGRAPARLLGAPGARVHPVWPALAAAAVLVAVAFAAFRFWQTAEGPPDRVLLPFMTWPSDEMDSRSSPDGRWVSFLSNRDGAFALFVQAIDASDARRVTLPPGRVISHLWSADGLEYACLIQLPDGLFLQVFPAPLGGAARRSLRLPARPSGVRLLRWIEGTIYLEARDEKTRQPALARIDLASEAMSDVSGRWPLPADVSPKAAYRFFDVSPNGRRVVFSLVSDTQEDLWLADIDGTAVSRVTNDAPFERYPVWNGRGDAVIYQSNRGGQLDLWELPIGGERAWQLTSDRAVEQPESASGDGGLITFRLSTETSHLWLHDPQARRLVPLTNDALSDLAPSVSRDGRTVVFQRMQASALAGNLILDSRLMKGTLSGQTLQLESEFVADGFAPKISPDGTLLAYLQGSPPVLQIKDLRTSQVLTVSKEAAPPAFSPFPNSWLGQTVAWSASTGDLLFVDRATGYRIRQYGPGRGVDETPIAQADRGWRIRDLFPSGDGRTVAYLKSSSDAHELHVVDLASRVDRLLRRIEGTAAVSAHGWTTGDRSVLLVREVTPPQTDADSDPPSGVEILEVDLSSGTRRLAAVDNALHSTARVDPKRLVAYVTRSVDQVHNLYTLALGTGALDPVTDNRFPSVSYTGLQPLASGAAVYFSSERRRDIYVYVPRTLPAR
jgi:Tol biopolymer transport system component